MAAVDDAPSVDAELLQKVSRQVHYYFSDRNLFRDEFLRELIASSKGGYVRIGALLEFPRLAALTASVDVVKLACRDSEVLQVHARQPSVRRRQRFTAAAFTRDNARTLRIVSAALTPGGTPGRAALDRRARGRV
eukprot:gnl/Chilomastix_cuspidata/5641.p1 GENE.gnl/Chilomastix_cuspidata/5641~~gnl/Chilomastix_cuspidata/5641.p1  ORF type:complete len:135 (+),score=43.39 gnl/Chilomastix_cuspidata/5641:412-816(+)